MSIDLTVEVAAALKAIAASNPPNWVRGLSAYKSDWPAAIGAKVMARDGDGVSVVSWCGHAYVRRSSPQTKYGAAVWFSRCTNDDGEQVYLRLITFKAEAIPHAEQLPDYVREALK